jgi:hypothetical protein
MRYIVALVVAALLTAGGVLYAQWTVAEIHSGMRDRLKEKQRTGELPPDLDLSNVGMAIPAAEMRRLNLAQWAVEYWFLWGATVIGLSLGVAAVIRRGRRQANQVSAESRT